MALIDIAQFYDEHFESVYNYVYFRIRNVEQTEDLVSEIFMKVVEKSHTYKAKRGATERSWLFAIVRNTLTDAHRKKRLSTVPIEDAEVLDHAPGPDHHTDIGLTYAYIAQHLDALPERQREILTLKYQCGFRNKDIAQHLGLAEASISAALSKALTTLRSQLQQTTV